MTRARRVSVVMCRSDVTDFRAALRDDADVEEIALRDGLPYSGKLFAQFDRRNQPDWLELLAQGAADQLPPHYNASNAAVLVIRRKLTARQIRYFAVPFGYGRFLLDPKAYERTFGLRVALNSIDPEQLVSLDMQTLQELPFHRRVQAGRGAPPGEFELDAYRDMLTSVTGRPSDGRSRRISGSDAAAVTRRVEFEDLGDLCDELAHAYRKRTYQKRFRWIDDLGQVRAPAQREELDNRLIDEFETRRAGRQSAATIGVAPPEIIDWLSVEGFWVSGTRTRRTAGLLELPDLDWYLARLPRGEAVTVDKLKRDRLEAHSSADTGVVYRWSLYRSLIADMPAADGRYLFMNGTWFEVARSLIDAVDRYVTTMPTSSVELPTARPGETEPDYNRRMADSAELYLLDRKTLPATETRGRIESCDLVHHDCAFIHVKRYRNASADLSHLFSQALVSATTFHETPSFRSEFRQALIELGMPRTSAHRLAPDDRPDPADFEIGYAIIVPPRVTCASELPFFAKLALMRTARLIEARGYTATLTLIATEAD